MIEPKSCRFPPPWSVEEQHVFGIAAALVFHLAMN
jgi:hypothetical protein